MTPHHTKDKGDFGVAKVFADLVAKGLMVLFPVTEHAPFDLVAYDGTRFVRTQVKYRSSRYGAVKVAFRSYWADQNGAHSRKLDKKSIDVIAIFCPEVNGCFYIDPTRHRESVTLRVEHARNGQETGTFIAAAFRDLPAAAHGG